MGTGQKIAEKRIAKFLKVSAFVLIPLVAVGAISIFVQMYEGDRKEFSLYDFTLGQLWPWSEKSKETAVLPKNQIFQVDHRSRNLDTKILRKKVGTRAIDKVQSVTKVFEKKKVTRLPLNATPREAFHPIKMEEIKSPKILLSSKSGRHLDLTVRERLIAENIPSKRKRFAVGASFAPSVTFRNLRYNNLEDVARVENDKAYTYGQTESYRDKHDAAILNFYSGIDIYLHVNDRLSIQSGVYYSSYGEELLVAPGDESGYRITSSLVEDQDPFKEQQALYRSPEQQQGTAQLIPFNNYYGFIELPVNFNYRVKSFKSVNLEAQAGFSYSYLAQADALMFNYSTGDYFWIAEKDFMYLNQHFLNLSTGVVLSQYFSKDVEMFINPQFKYSLTPIFTPDYEIKQNQWAAGMRLGMKVHL